MFYKFLYQSLETKDEEERKQDEVKSFYYKEKTRQMVEMMMNVLLSWGFSPSHYTSTLTTDSVDVYRVEHFKEIERFH